MPRDIPVGNGRILVCFDQNYRIRDFYFPHVGQENHVGGNHARFGVWVESQFSWLARQWKRDLAYEADTLVTHVNLYHQKMELLLTCRDAVDFHENIFLREITLKNLAPRDREVRLFFHQVFDIYGNDVGDTAAFYPKTGGIVHYKGNRYFLANGRISGLDGLFQFAVGKKGVEGKEGTFRDAEDGMLSGNAIAQGSVDSVIALSLSMKESSEAKAYYWIAAGENWSDVRRLNSLVLHKKPENLIRRTSDYWNIWVRKETPTLKNLPEKVGQLYRRSLLVLKTQIDWQGGILAANDSDVIQFNRDTYSYVWPRDAALVANALDLAGYPVSARDAYLFLADRIEEEGYLLHKYNPDGSLASSWHPWFQENTIQLPIQEDETALVIWALWNHFVLYRDIEFIKPLYRPLIKRAANFMCRYRNSKTGLPDSSYDLWEERRGILSYTVGAVFGGLTAASLFCRIFGETGPADRYRRAAADIRDAATSYLWRENLQRFCRMITVDSQGDIEVDETCDASLWGLFAFGLYAADDPRIRSTMNTLKEKLWVRTKVGGMARYENDEFNRVSSEVPGNPWFICSLWFADYLIEKARDENELTEAVDILTWVAEHALPSGILAEQVDPLTGEPLSVSPLTWSHATFVASCQHLVRRSQRLNICPECGRPTLEYGRREDWIEKLFSQTCDTIRGLCQIK
jgi:glucoamylase